MVYDPKIDMWVSTFAWHQPDLPPASAYGATYNLKATISDHRGGQATLAGLISGGGNFRVLKPGRLAFQRGGDIWMSNWDGSDPVIVAKGLGKPRWNHDGNAIVCTGPGNSLTLVTPDGRKRINLYTPAAGAWSSPGAFNAYDNKIVVATQAAAGGVKVGDISPWGPGGMSDWGVSALPNLGAVDFPPNSNPVVDSNPGDVNIAIVSRSDATGGSIVLIDKNTTPIVTTKLAVTGAEASFCPNGSEIVFRSASGQISRASIAGGVSATATLGGAISPRLAGSAGFCVVGGDDGGQRNIFVYTDGTNLAAPLKLFSFPESCTDPDWAD